MIIAIGDNSHELKTNLGIAKKIERVFNLSLNQMFSNLDTATTEELMKLLAVAAGKYPGDKDGYRDFCRDLEEVWGVARLQMAVGELIAHLMFSGTPEEMERQIQKTEIPDAKKNELRELLGLPIVELDEE
ncbi:MAG: hypothetical protein FH749_07835 [Firmicutes bacterium]|nr:hypothetical protein [Bacillota bacterium]